MNVSNKLQQEIQAHIVDHVSDRIGSDIGDLHHALFNESHYLIGYYQCEQWLKQHDISAFEAIEFVQEYERDNFGETNTAINSESIVNMLVYIVGEQVLYECLNNLNIDDGELTADHVEQINEYLSE